MKWEGNGGEFSGRVLAVVLACCFMCLKHGLKTCSTIVLNLNIFYVPYPFAKHFAIIQV